VFTMWSNNPSMPSDLTSWFNLDVALENNTTEAFRLQS
jgi:hypothetical protein